jgi:hypothetical protein
MHRLLGASLFLVIRRNVSRVVKGWSRHTLIRVRSDSEWIYTRRKEENAGILRVYLQLHQGARTTILSEDFDEPARI